MFDELRDLYQDIILDRGRRPRHGKRLAAYDVTGKGDNPMCGDRVEVFVRKDAEGGVAELGFEARGCAISVASADLMAEAVASHDRAAIQTLFARLQAMLQTGADEDSLLETLRPLSGVHDYPSRIKCATLPWHALIAALDGPGKAEGHE